MNDLVLLSESYPANFNDLAGIQSSLNRQIRRAIQPALLSLLATQFAAQPFIAREVLLHTNKSLHAINIRYIGQLNVLANLLYLIKNMPETISLAVIAAANHDNPKRRVVFSAY